MVNPTDEEYAAWRDQPITRWVLGAFAKAASENKQSWVETSWGTGNADQSMLIELKTRADAYMAVSQITYQDLLATLGGEKTK